MNKKALGGLGLSMLIGGFVILFYGPIVWGMILQPNCESKYAALTSHQNIIDCKDNVACAEGAYRLHKNFAFAEQGTYRKSTKADYFYTYRIISFATVTCSGPMVSKVTYSSAFDNLLVKSLPKSSSTALEEGLSQVSAESVKGTTIFENKKLKDCEGNPIKMITDNEIIKLIVDYNEDTFGSYRNPGYLAPPYNCKEK